MSNSINKPVLSRYIKDDIKKIIRQNSKFGCVVPNCRNIIYEYEHLLPEFKDAKIHDPEKMCLTCPTHNPRKAGINGEELYSKEQLIDFYLKIKESKEPLKITNKDIFSGFNNSIKVQLGSLICENISSLIEIDGNNIFSFNENPDKSIFAPEILFNGRFEKPNGKLLFEIIENEWLSNSEHGDLIYKNGVLTIFDENQTPIFLIRKVPTENILKIEKLDLWSYPFHIFIENGSLVVARHDLNNDSYIAAKIDATISHQNVAIKLSSNNLSPLIDFGKNNVTYSGNNGFKMDRNGIKMAFGAGISRIKRIHILTSIKGKNSGYKFVDVDDMIKKYGG
jgi:hypothetical protein